MKPVSAGLLALALVLAAGEAEARDWRCAATASLKDGSVQALVYADDKGKPTMSPGVAVVEYAPGPPRERLQLSFVYAANLQTHEMYPLKVKATVPVNRDAARGRLVLTVGEARSSWPIQPAFFGNSNDFTMWIEVSPEPASAAAILAGGSVRFEIIAENGEVKESQDLNLLSQAQLLPVVAKAYPVAQGFAQDPRQSSYCEPNRRTGARAR